MRHPAIIAILEVDVEYRPVIEIEQQIGDSLLHHPQLRIRKRADFPRAHQIGEDTRTIAHEQILHHRVVVEAF